MWRGLAWCGSFLVFLGLSLFPTLPAAAQQGPSRQSTSRVPATIDSLGNATFSISGRILDRQTNRGIDGARVRLVTFTGAYLQDIYVDSTGFYRFVDLRSGTYTLIASHPQYRETRERVELTNVPTTVYLHLEPKPRASQPLLLEPLNIADRLVPDEARQEYEKGGAQADKGNLREALEHFDKAVEIYPKYVSGWHAKGLIHLRLREAEQAQVAFEKAIEINPNLALPRILLGHVLNGTRQFQAALEPLLGAVRLRPDDWRGHFELSRTYLGLGKLDEAEKHIQRAHELNREASWVHLMSANVHLARQDFPEALKEMDHYLEVAPNGPYAAEVRRQRQQLKEKLAAQK